MKLAVFSDVHGNLEALDLFMAHAKSQGAHSYACLGDMIGYGPNPNECLEKIRSLDNPVVVMGNHEWAALNLEESAGFMNPMAHDAIAWTKKNLTPDNMAYIAELPDKVEIDRFTLVHASAFLPRHWEYLFSAKGPAIMICLQHSSTRYTLVGHTHRPMIADKSGESLFEASSFEDETTYFDDCAGKLLINPGSIGQPRGNFKKPSYVIMDTQENTITWLRLNSYDPVTTARKIMATDLPVECAYYLKRQTGLCQTGLP